MEDLKNKKDNSQDSDIIFSKAILSRKRIYYLDVRESRNGELFLIITERKKIVLKDSLQPVVFFEKHKIFLYKEDFEKFADALNETLSFIKNNKSIDSVTQRTMNLLTIQ